VFTIISDHIDALLHPSARADVLTRIRHRAFMAPRLIGSLIAFAAFPIYLALRGVPSAIEALVLGWLVTPILLSYFLSRTGRFDAAQMLSSLAMAALVLSVAVSTGGIASFAVVWLLVVPLEATLSASRRVMGFSLAVAIGSALILIVLSALGVSAPADNSAALMGASVIAAALYAAGVAYGAQLLTRARDALINNEGERYHLLARNMSDVLSRHRRDGAVLFISPAVSKLLGVPAAQLMGHKLFDRVHVADRPAYLTALSNAARGDAAANVEFRIRRDLAGRGAAGHASSQFIWIEMRCRPLDASDARAASDMEVVAVMRDITDRKMQEEALDSARGETERANDAKARFLATMSHELRTPLNAIIGFSEMITSEDKLGIDASRRKEYAKLINDSGLHLLSVVNSILDLSKMESGTFELAPEPFAPREALVNCCDLLALKARDGGVDLVTNVPEDLPNIVGDCRAFKQILLNLVANGIKFTERGGMVKVSACVESERLVVRVADTGIGIEADDLKRLGDPFFQAGPLYQRRHEGTGLGLSIVKSLVALHGGDMNVDSKIGDGTVVTVSLPLQAKPAAAAVSPGDRIEQPVASSEAPSNVAMLTPMIQNDRKLRRVKLSA